MLASLEAQTVSAAEVLICLGPSDDGTAKIVQDFAYKKGSRVRLFYDIYGLGTGYAMKILVEAARNECLLWAAADDVYDSDYFARVQRLLPCSYDLVVSPINGAVSNSVLRDASETEMLVCCKKLLKRSAILLLESFDSFFSRGQDLDLVVRLRWAEAKIGYASTLNYSHLNCNTRDKSWRKTLSRPTFAKLLYKYGWAYVQLNPNHAVAFILRVGFFSSLIAAIACFSLVTLAFSASLLASLTLGDYLTHGCFSFRRVFWLQVVQSFVEVFQSVRLLFLKKPHYGYGKRFVR